jgi:hypothetical protein
MGACNARTPPLSCAMRFFYLRRCRASCVTSLHVISQSLVKRKVPDFVEERGSPFSMVKFFRRAIIRLRLPTFDRLVLEVEHLLTHGPDDFVLVLANDPVLDYVHRRFRFFPLFVRAYWRVTSP